MSRRLATIITILLIQFILLSPAAALAKGVVLNFTDVDISTMVKFISDLTGKNFVMDDRVKGKISVFSPAKLSKEEAFNLFTSVLELKGFTLVQADKVYKIVPTAAAKQAGMKVLTGKERLAVNEAYVARVVPLDNISAQEAVAFLQPVVSKDGYISSFGPTNMLLIVDSSLNIQKILGIVRLMEAEQRHEGAELVFLKNASADNAARLLKEWLASRERGARPAGQVVQPGQPGGGPGIAPDSRLNALVISGREGEKEELKRMIAMIDVAAPEASSKVNVYYLENAEATEVAKVLETIIKAPPAVGQQVVSPQVAFEAGKINVTADKATNSLVVMASPADYQNLVQVIQKLDRRRRQVFVEAVIAEVSIDKLREIGMQLAVSGGGVTGNTAGAGAFDPFNFLSSTNPQQAAVITVLKTLSSSSNIQLGGVLKAFDSKGAVNVLSTPNIMTSDNREAEIFVGENVPFVSQTNLTSTGLSQQSIERKDTGITLRITPHISEGEYVKLDIYQEISAVKDNLGQARDLVTTKRSAKTSVVVKNKETVVIGGLIQDQEREVVDKIPILGDIPLLGWFFKSKSVKRQKTNLMILLTPNIIKDAQEVAAVSEQQRTRFEEAARSNQPFSLERGLKEQP